MNRDRILFLAFIGLFAVLNIYLLASNKLTANWDGIGTILAAGITLALYSFLYKDNPLFKFSEHLYVGVAAAYTASQVWFLTLRADVVVPVFNLDGNADRGNDWVLLIPSLLGIFMLMRFSRQYGWVSRISFAFVVGLGAGLAIPRQISSFILAQIEPSLRPLSLSWDGLDLLIILLGVVTVLIYFFYSVEHTGAVGVASNVGIWFLMISFGASFGYTIMARLSLLIGRVQFLMGDWLNLNMPLF